MLILEKNGKYKMNSNPMRIEGFLIGTKTCKHCNTSFSFEEKEVNTSKILPHVTCPECKKLVHLNVRWARHLYEKEGMKHE